MLRSRSVCCADLLSKSLCSIETCGKINQSVVGFVRALGDKIHILSQRETAVKLGVDFVIFGNWIAKNDKSRTVFYKIPQLRG